MKATTCVALVTCITKTGQVSPYQRISHIGGTGWRFTQEEAIQGILNEQYLFYILEGEKAVRLTIGLHKDVVYLKTIADGPHPNHLISLPECTSEFIGITQKIPSHGRSLAEVFETCPVYEI